MVQSYKITSKQISTSILKRVTILGNDVEIFKTDISDKVAAAIVLDSLTRVLPEYHFNVDLDDCDRVLRVASSCEDLKMDLIIMQVIANGFLCELIDY